MKKILLAFLIVIFMFSSPAYTQQVKAEDMSISNLFYEAYLDFSISSFQEVNKEDNLLYSPISLYYALSMMSVLSNEDTYLEFETLLGVDKATLLTQIPLLTNDILVDHEDADYWFANFLYYDNESNIGDEDYVFNESLLNQYQDIFNYELQNISFYDGAAGKMISEKINDGTNDFLDIKENDLASLLRANILFNNTIYYNGEWLIGYDESDNYEDSFYITDENLVIVEYMKKLDTRSMYYESEIGSAVKSYFKDGTSMIFVLPNEELTLDDLISNTDGFKDIIQNQDLYMYADTTLTIPKMERESKMSLVKDLKNLGLTSIFTESEETFPDLTPYPFSITDIWQASKIRVDEVGVEVAATTMSIGCAATAPQPPYTFLVDRPFIYIIMSSTDIPLFIGSVYSF